MPNMKQASLTRNAVMNGINQGSAVLLPLIVFPYLARVLLPDGLGRVNFAAAVVGLFTLVAFLGIPVYGVRATARVRDDQVLRSRLVVELFLLNVLMTLLAGAGFAVFMALSSKAQADPALFWICSIPLFFVPLGFDWFFQGVEEFSWVALRSLFFRLVLVAGVFLFVHEPSDYRVYALLLGVNVAGTGLLNSGFMIRRLNLRQVRFQDLNWIRHLKPVMLMFALWAVVTLYTSLDKVMLGYLSNEAEVGFYTVAERMVRVVTTIVSGLGLVLFPRLSYYLEQKRLEDYRYLAGRFLRILCFLCIPAAFGLVAVANPLIRLFAGDAFGAAQLPLRIMGVNVMMLALSSFLGLQVLYPQNREKLILYSVLLGAAANFGLNTLLIPRWQATGAAVATLAAESLVLLVQAMVSRPFQHFTWPLAAMAKYLLSAAVMGLLVWLLLPLFSSPVVQLAVCIGAGGLFYLGCMAVMRDEVLGLFFEKGKGLLRRL